MEKLYGEINSKFGLLLGLLAGANGFKREKNVFISKDGKRFIACRLGFVDAEKYRDKLTIERQESELIGVKEELKRLKRTLEQQAKAIGKEKNLIKVCRILESNETNEEKVKDLKRYLNL